MDFVIAGIGILIVLGIGAVFMQLRAKPTGSSDEAKLLQREVLAAKEKIGELQSEVKEIASKRDELQGKNKQMFAEVTTVKAEIKGLQREKEELKETISEYKESETRMKREFEDRIAKLDNAKKALEDEKARVIREDEEKMQEEIQERDRIWNDHENNVVALLTELCTQKEYEHTFKYFTNTKLPPDFDGSLKPDFLVEFLDQYVIFDAKCTKSEDISTYIANAVKSTVKKVKGNAKIYKTVFFVIPTIAIESLKKTSFHEQGITFHVISPEAMSPILAVFKRMSEYERIETMDPEERENIATYIARLDQHINVRNAHDLIMSQMGGELLREQREILPELSKTVEMKKQKMSLPKMKPSEIMRLASSPDSQMDEIRDIVSPKAGVTKKTLKQATEMEEIRLNF